MSEIYHPKLSTLEEIEEALQIINKTVNGCGFTFKEDSDGRYNSIAFANAKEDTKIVLAGTEFSYYHMLELAFHKVSFTNIPANATWWDHWTEDQIELLVEIPGLGFQFQFNNTTDRRGLYHVTCESFSYHFGSVSHWR